MFSENTFLMLYLHAARSIFCEMATGVRLRVAKISHSLFSKIIAVAHIPRVV